MRLIPRAGYVSMPWKNGKGVTLEIARAPAAPLDYDWRLSLASIDVDGPFSHFPGYERLVVLVEGAGFTLDICAQGSVALDAPGRGTVFPGDVAVMARLHAGPCRDLSLMVRRPGRVFPAEVLELTTVATLAHREGVARALYALAGTCRISARAGTATALCAGDTAFVDDGDTEVSIAPDAGGARLVLLSFAPTVTAPAPGGPQS